MGNAAILHLNLRRGMLPEELEAQDTVFSRI
jgi:hypothetical protein